MPAGVVACPIAARLAGVEVGEFCAFDEASAVATPALTPGLIARAFNQLELPASDLQIQPPDGLTLVNFDTNFYVDSAPISRSIQLLGQRIDLRIWAARYTWRFGDGTSLETTEPGTPYPALTITHNYRQTGTYRPRVDTTYQAEFRLGNGPWRPVSGTSTVSGAPEGLRAIEAQPKLVGYDG